MTEEEGPRNDRGGCHYEHLRGVWRPHCPGETAEPVPSVSEKSRSSRRWNGEIASSGLASLAMIKRGITASEVQSPAPTDITGRCSSPIKLSMVFIGLMNYYLCHIISR